MAMALLSPGSQEVRMRGREWGRGKERKRQMGNRPCKPKTSSLKNVYFI